MNIGFIGLGAMGLPMAKNVIRGGHSLVVMVHSNTAPISELKLLGAKVVQSPNEVATGVDAVITVLPADRELRQVVLGEKGLITGMKRGQVLIDMTTSKSSTLVEIAKTLESVGVDVIDAPVSGGTTGAQNGELTIILGGDDALIENWRPLLETMGSKLFKCGPVGAGKVVKMVNQQMAAVHLLVIGEAFALGKKAGADPQIMYDVIKESSGYSRMMDLRLPGFLLEGESTAGFKLDLMKKDVNLALESAMDLNVPLTLGSTASQVFAAASRSGLGEEDFSAAAGFLAKLAGENLSIS